LVSGPISPHTTRNYFIGFASGLSIPFLLFILFEISNTKVQSREDIEKITSIPFIGGVGHKRMDQNLEVLLKPKSAISESFRALRSNLNYFLDGNSKGVFLITSSVSGEGKTFTSINLASVFALSGKKTLIVGADMRKPKIFTDFKLDNSVGLSNYLAGLNDFDEIVRPTQFENLYLISGGPVPPNPSELILNIRMESFLQVAREKFDFIFIDSPPLALVTDAFVLSGLVDHTLFIIRQNYTPKALLKTINDFYAAGKISKISFVLNDIYKSGPGYGYGYAYGYGYGYNYLYGFNSRSKSGGYYEE
jgi:capsular exopolysaccharide synthesis family protein